MKIEKRPQFIDKNTYISIEFQGRLYESQPSLISGIDMGKVLFYPHRDGIKVDKKFKVKTKRYLVWNQLNEEVY